MFSQMSLHGLLQSEKPIISKNCIHNTFFHLKAGISGIKVWHFKIESRPISISILIVHCVKYPLKNVRSDISQCCDTSSTCQSLCVCLCVHPLQIFQ